MAPKKSHGKTARLTKLQGLLQKERWTEKAPLATSVPLLVTIQMPVEDLMFEMLREGLPKHVDIRVGVEQKKETDLM